MLPCATLIGYLDRHAGAFAALLTLALVVVTIYYAAVTTYYAVQNRRMVEEMERTRELSLLPRLAIEFHRLGPTAVTVVIANVGPGAALDIDVRLRYEPKGQGAVAVENRWRRNILISGAQYDFIPPGGLNDNLNGLPASYRDIRLVGSMRDATGKHHEVNETFADLAEWREVLKGAHQRFSPDDPERRFAEALAKQIEAPATALTQELRSLTRAVYRLQPSQQEKGGAV